MHSRFPFHGYSSLCLSCMFLSTIACQYPTCQLLLLLLCPRAIPCGQQSYYTHVYSSSGAYGGRIPPLVLSTYSYGVYAHACWRFMIADIPRSGLWTSAVLLLREGRPHYSVPGSLGVGREGCFRRTFPNTHPPSKRKT